MKTKILLERIFGVAFVTFLITSLGIVGNLDCDLPIPPYITCLTIISGIVMGLALLMLYMKEN